MKKRYRDENGRLIVSLEELRELTKKEGKEYYQIGKTYRYHGDGEIYEYVSNDGGLMTFESDMKAFFIAEESCGTFLPDIASDGEAIELVEIEEEGEVRTMGKNDLLLLAKRIFDNVSDGYDDEEEREETEKRLFNELSDLPENSLIKAALQSLCERVEDLQEL